MLRSTLFVVGLLISLLSASQVFIKGRVVNAATGVAIPGSSVFISNTSIGTVSNAEGYFELNTVPPGKQELIISSIGFETVVYPFTEAQLPLSLKVEMNIKVQQLGNVTVEPSVEEDWDKWGKTFMDNFIGVTENAAQCRIKNTDKIKFRYFKKSNRVIAYSDEPVLIENKALGYTIHYQLEDFEVNFKERTTFYLGYTLFEDHTKDGKEPKNKWQRNREEAYKGSVLHFMRSLYNNRLLEEGFEVRRLVKTPNLEKQRIRTFYKPRVITGSVRIEAGSGVTATPAGGDSAEYYQRVLRQPDLLSIYGNSLLNADSLTIGLETGEKFMNFDNYIYVTYKNELEEPGYLRSFMENRKPTYQRSEVSIIGNDGIVVDKVGNYFNPQHFFTSAYWGWSEKIANMVPTDYVPGK